MQAYCVTQAHTGARYYVLANSESHALERVTLHLGDASGKEAWSIRPDADSYELSEGIVLDGAGKPIKSVEA